MGEDSRCPNRLQGHTHAGSEFPQIPMRYRHEQLRRKEKGDAHGPQKIWPWDFWMQADVGKGSWQVYLGVWG